MPDISLNRAAAITAVFTAALWAIQVAALSLDLPVGLLGIRPGQTTALHGVLTAPLVHGSFTHLLTNTPPLLVLGTAMLYGFPRASKIALPMIWLGSGAGVWLLAREGTHLGASGLTYGMMFFVFVIGVLRRDRPSMALAMIVFFLYGSMVWGILPTKPGISFESHLFGALAGVLAAFLLRRRDPLTPRRRYEWESDPSPEAEDPVIGDLWRDAQEPETRSRTPSRRRDE
ncbi:MAG: rhomboid family intramembrane serine protease [Gammaproteobacteria bacterium]|nr:rhomboid family intramembrane serine protease [Gammaproteobacteria bacterium]NIR58135.1 rhomboid family intramembrane serine protease [Gammaproteobacteria bacterium]NIR88132.1 rhomboid family intramembrane serine protease [Gammaproteobacteria bacterium]